jgi:hypothetical protein
LEAEGETMATIKAPKVKIDAEGMLTASGGVMMRN